MTFKDQQLWQEASRRLQLLEASLPLPDADVDAFLATLPQRLPQESYSAWLSRGQKLARVVPFSKIHFQYLTEIQILAADTHDSEDALTEIPLISVNQQFRMQLTALPENKIKLTLSALGLASSRYANCVIGIAASDNKEQLISLIRLNAEGDGVDASLEDSPVVRQALLHPVIALIEQADA